MGEPVIDCEKGWSRLASEVSGARRGSWLKLRRSWSRFLPSELASMRWDTQDYYTRLYSLVDGLESADVNEGVAADADGGSTSRVDALIYGSLISNLVIFATKVVVAISSGALVVYASALDSLLDILSGSILSITTWKMSRPAPDRYPVGKERMEPLGVIVFAAVMGTCYLQVIVEAVSRLTTASEVVCDASVLTLLGCVVAFKGALYLLCRTALASMAPRSPALEAQAQDHFNDCLVNALSAVGTFLASSLFSRLAGLGSPTALYFIDPISAAVFSVYLIYSWVQVARENIVSLVGRAAPPELLQRVTYLTAVHCSEIIAVDTTRCYRFGPSYIAEVDIVLPPDMPNRQAHDVAESLQVRIEALTEISRCFVHIDWETTHKPEHKV